MKVVIYPDRRGEWRWQIKAKNGRILADGAEGYKTEAGVRRACTSLSLLCAYGLAAAFGSPTVGAVPTAKKRAAAK